MSPENQTDHIAILALMMVGVLAKRLHDVDMLDDETEKHLHKLVQGVRKHAETVGITDMNALFTNIERHLNSGKKEAA